MINKLHRATLSGLHFRLFNGTWTKSKHVCAHFRGTGQLTVMVCVLSGWLFSSIHVGSSLKERSGNRWKTIHHTGRLWPRSQCLTTLMQEVGLPTVYAYQSSENKAIRRRYQPKYLNWDRVFKYLIIPLDTWYVMIRRNSEEKKFKQR